MARNINSVTVAGLAEYAGPNLRRRQLLDTAVRVVKRTGGHQVSMQAMAREAGVSVGLLYKYFDSKDDILLAAVVDILDDFQSQLQLAVESAGTDPVDRFVAGFKHCCETVDSNPAVAVLTYSESRIFDEARRDQIRTLEIDTMRVLRNAIKEGVAKGMMISVDIDLMVVNAIVLAHGWTLKRWHFGNQRTIGSYIDAQTSLLLQSLLTGQALYRYRHLL
ncbi:TetR/AcrR family transcriptional regulator [Rhodococcus qingshengii]|uniref:TetR/AcrR family transcriptional regulator n=1 Tax=Rhodococcus qingshengii TaxID=334542 RepID=UPI0010A60945|nr:TetR/AcrR family transcriptional regulator [Rhodococcus qingshengii]THJ67659.1 TetR/AcrR family transcriptional regulator [Rhodococcus qingshengii]